jgi:hypothetical protein
MKKSKELDSPYNEGFFRYFDSYLEEAIQKIAQSIEMNQSP